MIRFSSSFDFLGRLLVLEAELGDDAACTMNYEFGSREMDDGPMGSVDGSSFMRNGYHCNGYGSLLSSACRCVYATALAVYHRAGRLLIQCAEGISACLLVSVALQPRGFFACFGKPKRTWQFKTALAT